MFITPKRTIKVIAENDFDKKTRKLMINLYWFICIRLIFNSLTGIDLENYSKYSDVFWYIYEEIDI